MSATTFLSGFLIGLSLIAALGPQSILVLRQGLRGEHVALVCGLCILSDAVLIGAGVLASAEVARSLPGADPLLRLGGSLMLATLGLVNLASALSAVRPEGGSAPRAGRSPGSAAAGCLAVTWLNPLVYLDTVIVLGAIGQAQDVPEAFAVGAFAASIVFFLGIGYGARGLRGLFASRRAWQSLDALTGAAMLAFAVLLVRPLLAS